ncbi:MAG: GntR family transcriptional regulator, partial [Endozoicomonas sp.]
LVIREPHVGARVVRLTRQELSEIFTMREALEGVAAREAAKNITEDELIDLGQLIESHARYVEVNNGESYMDQEGDYDFHYRIINASGNLRLIQLLCNELYHLIRIYRKSSTSEARPERAIIEHKMIFQALQDRDGELAELLMRKHIRRAGREIENTIES